MGAKFSSGSGATVFYDDGPITAPSGEQGTQRNEFEAAIKSVTSATTVGAVFVYDTRNDSDGGAWRRKARGSWYYEDLNTATRGGRREFPSVALIVADNVSGSETVAVYDLDDPSMPMWMVFNAGNTTFVSIGAATRNSIFMLNGQLYVGLSGYGLAEIDFTNDRAFIRNQTSHKIHSSKSIADRNVVSDTRSDYSSNYLANHTVNDVAATIVEGAEIGALGLPIPTVAVACGTGGSNGGISVIHPNGDVYDISEDATCDSPQSVSFDGDKIVGVWNTIGAANRHAYIHSVPFADQGADDSPLVDYGDLTTSADLNYGHTGVANTATATAKNSCAYGSDSGLTLFKNNYSNPAEGAVAYVTSTYNTGYMLGDIRLAALANANAGDRSVKGNTLTVNNTSGSDYVEEAAVATNAELKAYSNFKAGNYLSRADADLGTTLDFCTGDFSIMFWVKTSDVSDVENYVARMDASLNAGDWTLLKAAGGAIQFYRYTGSSWVGQVSTATGAIAANAWTQCVMLRRGTTYQIYINGKLNDNGSSQTNNLTLDNSGVLSIGHALGNAGPADTSSLSLVRISATAPTPQQVADIYRAEAPLFRSGAKCLLSQVTHTSVNDLAYDQSNDLLYVGTTSADAGDSVSTYRGLERVDTKDGQDLGWDGASAHLVTAAAGVFGYARTSGTGGLVLDLPAIDVRGDINTADTKLPDDGKLHFSGVTTDATPTVIGQIPIAGGENYIVKANVIGCRYQLADSAHRIIVDLKGGFSRTMSGNVVAEPLLSKLSELEWSSSTLDVEYDVDTSANTIRIKVTGHSAVNVEWNAEVEVQRISEKTYER